jgi:NDP-sugar pyrophosphorylase family protein
LIYKNKFIKTAVLFLCGGISSRLKTNNVTHPKVLIPIKNERCSLDFCFDLFKSSKDCEFYINFSEEYDLFNSYIEKKKGSFHNINKIIEKKPSGTVRPILKVLKEKDYDQILVINGDTICKIKLNNFCNFHILNKSNFTLVSNYISDVSSSGLLELDNKKILSIIEKSKMKIPGWVNSGIYLINKNYFKYFKGCFDLSYDFIPKILKNRKKIFVYKTHSKLIYAIDTKKMLQNTIDKIKFT